MGKKPITKDTIAIFFLYPNRINKKIEWHEEKFIIPKDYYEEEILTELEHSTMVYTPIPDGSKLSIYFYIPKNAFINHIIALAKKSTKINFKKKKRWKNSDKDRQIAFK